MSATLALARPARPYRSAVLCLASALSLAACGGGGDPAASAVPGDGSGSIAAGGPLSPVDASADPASVAADGVLAAGLRTKSGQGDEFDMWFCSGNSGSVDAVGYAFAADGTGTHYEVFGDDIGPVAFRWRVAGADAVELSYPGAADTEVLEAIAFGDDAWMGTSSADGSLDCTLQPING